MLFDTAYFDQKWSVWDTWRAIGRNVRVYVMTAAYKMANVITAQNRRSNVVTAQNRRTKVITAGG